MTETHQAFMRTLDEMGFLDEAFVGSARPASYYYDADKYDLRRSPSARGEMDTPRPLHSRATVQDLRDVCNKVAARHPADVALVRVLGEVGFVCSFTIPGGLYQGTTNPSVANIEQEMIHELRAVAPAAIVDLLTADTVSGDGPTSRRLFFRFRLHDVHRGDLGGP